MTDDRGVLVGSYQELHEGRQMTWRDRVHHPHASARKRRRPCSGALMAGAVAMSIAFASCSPSDEGTQPAPAVTTFGQGDFEGLPLPPRSEPLGQRSEQDGVVSRSYAVRDTSPELVLEFYSQRLPASAVVEQPHEIGVGTLRGRWLLDGRELTVSATVDDTLEAIERFGEDAGVISQLSLSLGPAPEER